MTYGYANPAFQADGAMPYIRMQDGAIPYRAYAIRPKPVIAQRRKAFSP
jgi:hypothetical protein